MSHAPTSPLNLTLEQQIRREKLAEDMAKILNNTSKGAIVDYAKSIAKRGDWLIEEQSPKMLPLSLSQIIPMDLRDVGQSLIERTRLLNELFVGVSFRTAEVILTVDPELNELRSEIIKWGSAVVKEVHYKLRHQIKKNPFRALFSAFDSFISDIDNEIAHSKNSIFPFAWSNLIDMIVQDLIELMLLQPQHCIYLFTNDPKHKPNLGYPVHVISPDEVDRLRRMFNMFSIESYVYLKNVVLVPLLSAVKEESTKCALGNYRSLYKQMFSDIVEASPYLMSSGRHDRFIFSLPGTSCVATIHFLSSHGCGRIVIDDDEERLIKGLHCNSYRAGLNIAYDGEIHWWCNPGRTLSAVFGQEDGYLLGYWLLKQVHDQVVNDYLKIQNYYLHSTNSEVDDSENTDASVEVETLKYVTWAKAADTGSDKNDDHQVHEQGETANRNNSSIGTLPHLRRRHFFKLLERCGAYIEQGKGSEIKLLRKSKRPFRLGNHYGSNPTIPAFLAADILKRLEITKDEWIGALNSEST